MKNLLRRAAGEKPSDVITVKELVMDRTKRTVTVKGQNIDLTAKEFDILYLLITNPGKVYRREDLLKLVWKDYLR